jgi:hypothetical protein
MTLDPSVTMTAFVRKNHHAVFFPDCPGFQDMPKTFANALSILLDLDDGFHMPIILQNRQM